MESSGWSIFLIRGCREGRRNLSFRGELFGFLVVFLLLSFVFYRYLVILLFLGCFEMLNLFGKFYFFILVGLSGFLLFVGSWKRFYRGGGEMNWVGFEG